MGAAAPRDMHAVFALLIGLPRDSGYKPGYSGFRKTPGETPGISPDTPGSGHSGGNSGYRPGNSVLGSPDTPGIRPDTPDFFGNVLGQRVQFLCKLLVVVSSHWLF